MLFTMITFDSDWVFKIPHEYHNCERSEEECERLRSPKKYEYNRFVDANNTLQATCREAKDSSKLPDWEWEVPGKVKRYIICYLTIISKIANHMYTSISITYIMQYCIHTDCHKRSVKDWNKEDGLTNLE